MPHVQSRHPSMPLKEGQGFARSSRLECSALVIAPCTTLQDCSCEWNLWVGIHSGSCAGDIENFCSKLEPGEQRLAICLTTQQDEEAKGNTEGMLDRNSLFLAAPVVQGLSR